ARRALAMAETVRSSAIRGAWCEPDLATTTPAPSDATRETSMIPKSGYRFPAFAKPATAGEGRSDKIMRKNIKP
ncbi:MAG: hypothetical protein WAM62_00965, partial [Pseudolabrys sp.]